MIAHSSFDSAEYGLRIGRLVLREAAQVDAALAVARAETFDVLFARVPADAHYVIAALAARGHTPLETLVTSTWNGRTPAATTASVEHHATLTDARDIDAVVAITGAITNTHYHTDPRLPIEATRTLYGAWARNDVTGRAQRVLVVRDGRDVIGYLAVLVVEQNAIIDLVAVSPAHQGRGAGAALLASFLEWAEQSGLGAKVGTQSTNPALRLYQRFGFEPSESQMTFHVWLD